jgi:Tfp pilus assembly protein PilF/peroxiredoxin
MFNGNKVFSVHKKKFLWLASFFILWVFVFTTTGTPASQNIDRIGSKSIDFSLKDLKGKRVSLSDFYDKPVIVLIFWSTWSKNSKEELKRFNSYYQKYREKGIQVIGINTDNQHISELDMQEVKAIVNELSISYPIVLDNELKTFHAYGIVALPTTIIISKDKITYSLPGLPLVETDKMFDYLGNLIGELPRQMVAVKPRHAPKAVALVNLARKLAKKNMYNTAYSMLNNAIKQDPGYITAYLELAKLYETNGKLKDAEDILRKAQSIEPDNQIVMSELGFCLTKNDKAREAVDLLNKAVELGLFPASYYYFAYALGRNGQLEKSLQSFEKAIEIDPSEIKIYELRAEIFESKNMLKKASADYRKVLELILMIRN